MLIPDRKTNPDWTVLNTALLLLKLLWEKHTVDICEIYIHVKNKLPKCEPLILSALGFLYLFDKIEYNQKTKKIVYKV